MTQRENGKCKNKCAVFKGTHFSKNILDHVLEIKREAKRVFYKIFTNNLHLIAHKESGFDSYVVLNNLPQWRTTVSFNKTGSGLSSKTFSVYVDQLKKIFSMFILDMVSCILKILQKDRKKLYITTMFT